MSRSGTTYPYRPHELNAAAPVLAKGAEKVGIRWAPTPLATISAPRGLSPPCVYCGFCVNGCATNAKLPDHVGPTRRRRRR
jgi:ferredoxin